MRALVRATLALLALTIAPRAASAQQPPVARTTPQGIVVDFQDAELRTVITALAEAANLNIVFGELPSRRVTLRLRQPVPADSVAPLLRVIAEANGLEVFEEAGLMRFAAPPPVLQAPAAQTAAEPQLFVLQLKHANATRLASTLQGIFGGTMTSVAGISRQPLSERLREQQIAPILLDTLGRRGRVDAPQQPGVLPGQLQGDVQIVPDETTNSLLVRAVPADWAVIERAIQAVDLRPLQVLIEVLIAEVRRDRELEVSISGEASRPGGAAISTESAELKGISTGDLLLKWMNGGSVDIQVALSALATRGDVRILSRPVLLAQNNQEARILIGSQRPFIQVFRSLPTETGVRDQIVQYRDVGTALTILPTINQDGYVNLELTQEVSSATNETQFGAPVISTREASTFLFVRDGQTTVIGGLIDRQGEKSRRGIPLLVDIPVLGGLFGTTRDVSNTSELFLFLTPHVVRSDEDLDRLRGGVERRLELLEREIQQSPPVVPPTTPPPSAPPQALPPAENTP